MMFFWRSQNRTALKGDVSTKISWPSSLMKGSFFPFFSQRTPAVLVVPLVFHQTIFLIFFVGTSSLRNHDLPNLSFSTMVLLSRSLIRSGFGSFSIVHSSTHKQSLLRPFVFRTTVRLFCLFFPVILPLLLTSPHGFFNMRSRKLFPPILLSAKVQNLTCFAGWPKAGNSPQSSLKHPVKF